MFTKDALFTEDVQERDFARRLVGFTRNLQVPSLSQIGQVCGSHDPGNGHDRDSGFTASGGVTINNDSE